MIAVVAALAACNEKHRLIVTNEDAVGLDVNISTSDGSLNWQGRLSANTSLSVSVAVNRDAVFKTDVIVGGLVVQTREKGYVFAVSRWYADLHLRGTHVHPGRRVPLKRR